MTARPVFAATLTEATAAGLVPVALDTWAVSSAEATAGVSPAAFRAEVERRLGLALDAERARRRALAKTGLGSWYLPNRTEHGSDGWNLWESSYALAGAIKIAKDALSSYPGAPLTVRQRVETLPAEPGEPAKVRATVTLLTRADPPQVAATASFTTLDAGEEGPLGFIPDGAEIAVQGNGEEQRGALVWSLGDRLEGREPRLRRYGSTPITTATRAKIVRDDEYASAIKMALTMAVNNARACAQGWGAACATGDKPADAWPPKPRARSGVYSKDEWMAAIAQMAALPEVQEAVRAGRLPGDDLRDWFQHLREIGGHMRYSPLPAAQIEALRPAWLRALMVERAAPEGWLRLVPEGARSEGSLTFPALVARAEKRERLAVALDAAETPEEAVALYRAARAEYPTAGYLSYLMLTEPLKRLGWSWSRDTDRQGDLYDITEGRVTWADFAARRKAKVEKETAEREAREGERNRATMAMLRRFAPLISRFTPGFYTTEGVRTRVLKPLGFVLDTISPPARASRDPWRVRLQSRPGQPDANGFALVSVVVPPEDDDREATAIRRFVDAVARFVAGAPRGETDEAAGERWERIIERLAVSEAPELDGVLFTPQTQLAALLSASAPSVQGGLLRAICAAPVPGATIPAFL